MSTISFVPHDPQQPPVPPPMPQPVPQPLPGAAQPGAGVAGGGQPVDRSTLPPDFPDTDAPGGAGLTLVCLENALINRYAQYATDNNIQFDINNASDREHALKEMKKGIHNVHGHLLKQGNRADSPVVVDTYTRMEVEDRHETSGQLQARVAAKKARGEKLTSDEKWGFTQIVRQQTERSYYKFHMTWEIEVTLPDGKKETLSKTQWVKTGVALPKPLTHPSHLDISKNVALLAVKATRHIHKAALDPKHEHYEKVKDCIQHLRGHDLISPGHIGPHADVHFASKSEFGLKEVADYTSIRLRDKKGKVKKIHIWHSETGRKLDATFTKWEKTAAPDERHPNLLTHGYKLRSQALDMVVRDPQLKQVEELDELKSDELDRRYRSTGGGGAGAGLAGAAAVPPAPGNPMNLPGQNNPDLPPVAETLSRTKKQFNTLKNGFNKDEKQMRLALLDGMKQGTGFSGKLMALGVSVGAFFAEKKIINKLTTSTVENFEEKYNAFKGGTGNPLELKQAYEGVAGMHAQIVKLKETLETLEETGQRISALERIHAEDAIKKSKGLGDDGKAMLLAHLAGKDNPLSSGQSALVRSLQKKLTLYQSIIDLGPKIDELKPLFPA